MDNDATVEIYEYLKNMAASIVRKDTADLKIMKADLDEYAQNLSSQMPQESWDVMNREFEKCRRCAKEWIAVYNDTSFNEAVKEDILKEDVMEFFFSMNEKVVAVQKNFFLLAMIDQQISPTAPLTEQQRSVKIAKSRILALAKEQGLTPSSKIYEKEPQRLWFFGDEINLLQSSEEGLTDDEALDYLLD